LRSLLCNNSKPAVAGNYSAIYLNKDGPNGSIINATVTLSCREDVVTALKG